MQEQLQQREIGEKSTPGVDFPRALREWATHLGITPEQAQVELDAWIAEVREQSDDLTELARAVFLARQFAEAARLWDLAAADKLARSHDLAEKRRQLTEAAVVDLIRAGEAFAAAGEHAEALARFERALKYSPREANPTQWAQLQNWLGICHLELGIRVEGHAADEHLEQSIAALRNSLQVRTRERLPWHWAGSQNNLGNALTAKARLSGGANSRELLAEGVSAYRLALTVYTREEFPPRLGNDPE